MAEEFWASRFKGKDYRLTTQDLTVGKLRQLKAWFGADYGAYSPFIRMLALGDIDALTCAVWLAQTKAGERPKEPRELDFTLDDFEPIEEAPEPDEKPDPTPTAAIPTSDSPPTSSSSETSTSSDSST